MFYKGFMYKVALSNGECPDNPDVLSLSTVIQTITSDSVDYDLYNCPSTAEVDTTTSSCI